MKNLFRSKPVLNIFPLIILALFFYSPKIILAEDLKNIGPEEIEKYLELPDSGAEKLLNGIIQPLTTQGINLLTSAYATDQEIAAAFALRSLVRIKILNNLLIDAPVEVAFKIIKTATEIARFFMAEDISSILDKLEQKSVKEAISYGMKALLQNEIRITPGAIQFKYVSYKGEKKQPILQYLITYKPLGVQNGEVLIKFFSPKSIDPPKPDAWMMIGTSFLSYEEIPPFIIEIHGLAEDYEWISTLPSIRITFPKEVPDLGIEPSSFGARNFLEPIKNQIKELTILLTKKAANKDEKTSEPSLSQTIINIWNKVQATISQIKNFLPAALIQPSLPEQVGPAAETEEEAGQALPENASTTSEEASSGELLSKTLTFEEIQEILDDLIEKADALSVEVNKLVGPISKDAKKELEEEPEEELTEEEALAQAQEFDVCNSAISLQPLQNKVVINEVAWMGTPFSYTKEWMELRNISNEQVNLTGWQLLNKDNKIKIIFGQNDFIPVGGFYLLERSSDDAVPGISANRIYSGSLKNNEEALYLFDQNCTLQDEVLGDPSWPAGDNNTKRTAERKLSFGWQTSRDVGGTPKKENSSGHFENFTGGENAVSSPSLLLPKTEVLISEVQIEGEENNYDFIELYNFSTTSVDLSGFQLKKRSSSGSESSVRLFPTNSVIQSQSYFLWANSDYASFGQITANITSTQTLASNNSIALLDKEKNIIDAVAWGSSTESFVETNPFGLNPEKNQSLNRKWSLEAGSYVDTNNNQNDFEIQEPTPGLINKIKENQPPFAYFTIESQNIFIGQGVIFNASSATDSDGVIVSYIWDFGDGNNVTSTSQNTITYSFASSGEFIITLLVKDDDGVTSLPASTTINILTAPNLSVVINEIGWMGTKSSSADEWIELYNNNQSEVDLNNWTLIWSYGTTTHTITFSTSSAVTTTMPANGFYLIERSDDNTVSDISADWFGSFKNGLNNNGEKLELKNAAGELVDLVDCSQEWFFGTASPHYISMERISVLDWGTDKNNWANNNLIARNGKDADGNYINGTPKAENSVSKKETEIPNPSLLPFDEFPELTFPLLGSPYIIGNHFFVEDGKTLNIEPGVTLKFSAYYAMIVRGSLNALGKEGKEITLTLNSPTPPADGECWYGIRFENEETENQISSRLEYVKLEKAWAFFSLNFQESVILWVEKSAVSFKNLSLIGGGIVTRGIILKDSFSVVENLSFSNFNTALYIEGGTQTVKNSNFSGNYIGISLINGAVSEIEGNIFENNVTPIYSNGAYPSLENNQAQNNNLNGIVMGGGEVSTTTWKADLPYIIDGISIASGVTLTIEPGVIVKFSGGGMEVSGKLIAEGGSTDNKKIVFTSYKDDDYGGDTNNDGATTTAFFGNWGALRFHSPDSILNNVVIRYGGVKGDPWWSNIGVVAVDENIEILIQNSLIERNVYALSFPPGYSCDLINAKIFQLQTENNVVFRENQYLTYPICP